MQRKHTPLIFRFALPLVLLTCAGVPKSPSQAQPPHASPNSVLRQRAAAENQLAVRFADWVLSRWPDPTQITTKGWEYNNGIVLYGIQRVYQKTGDPRYLAYIQKWVDSYVNEEGHLVLPAEHNQDLIQPGVLLLFLHEKTGLPKYRRAAEQLRKLFDSFPRNAQQGFWHKTRYPNEMWLDGIYMAEPFLVRYGSLFNDAEACNEIATFQVRLIARKTLDDRTGLFVHAWDEDRNAVWADKSSGRSPLPWSRATGWFAMALVDILPYLPASHPERKAIETILGELARGLKRTQDADSGLWYQVLDKGHSAGNWQETSGTGMFVYALKRGVEQGDLPAEYLRVAERGWKGLKTKIVFEADGSPVITDAVEGMGVQVDYNAYIGKQTLRNSTHGLCAVLLAASQMENFGDTRH